MFILFFSISVLSFFAVFICVILLPTTISDKKKLEGYSGGDMFGIPEMYTKAYYKKNKLWIRKVLIYGPLIMLGSLLISFLFI